MRKPKVNYMEYIATRNAIKTAGTVANLIERYMQAFANTETIGTDTQYRLRMLQRSTLGAMLATSLKRSDVIGYCQERRKTVAAATVNHDVVCLSTVLKYAGSGVWADCLDVSAAEVLAAKPFLSKHDLIGKSIPRERRPQPEEVSTLEAYFAKQNEHERTKVDMVLLTRWQIASGRRVGESCKLLWEDWNRESQTILVRKMKDPKRKNKQKVVALTAEAQALLVELDATRNPAEPRIFPFNSKTASARYTMAKKALGIEGLRLHDSRRDCASRLSEQGYSSNQIRMVTGHETTVILDRTYNKPDPAKFKDMRPAARQEAA